MPASYLSAPKPAYLGFGLGLRPQYFQEILTEKPNLDWLEITTENYLIPGGKPLFYLDKLREHYPMVMHGVSLSLGSTDALDFDYLSQVKTLARRVEPAWISDHLCWTGINGLNMHDLLPLPYTKAVKTHLVSRIQAVQTYLDQRIAIENVSSYLSYKMSDKTEWDFIAEVCEAADCYLLLDVNNIYVSAVNHGFDPLDYLNALPAERIIQIHLAGHSNYGQYIIDTHDAAVIEPVFALYREAIKRFGKISTMIERDDQFPPLSELLQELAEAKRISQQVLLEDVAA